MSSDTVHIHKKSWKTSVLNHGKWYLLSSIMVKGINFFLLPLYTRYLTTAEYGELNVLLSVSQFFSIVVSLYIDSAFAKFFHTAKHSEDELRRLFSSVFWFLCIYGAVVVSAALLTARWWLDSLIAVPLYYGALVLLAALFTQIGQLGLVFLRQSLLAKETTFIELESVLVGAVVTVPLLIWLHMGVLARLLGLAATGAFLFMYYVRYFRRRGLLVFDINMPMLKMCLAYSLPLIPNVLGSWISGYSDRLLLAKYFDNASVGIYSLSFQLGFLLYAVQDAITQVTSPIVVSGMASDHQATKAKLARLACGLFGVVSAAYLVLVVFSRELVLIIGGAKYHNSVGMIAIISYSYVVAAMYRTFTDVLVAHGKSFMMSAAGIIMGTVTLSLNLIFVPKYGYAACAWSFMLGTVAYLAVIFLKAQSIDKTDMEWGTIAAIFVTTVAVVFAVRHFDMDVFGWRNLLYKCCVLSGGLLVIGFALRRHIFKNAIN